MSSTGGTVGCKKKREVKNFLTLSLPACGGDLPLRPETILLNLKKKKKQLGIKQKFNIFLKKFHRGRRVAGT
jgi:hypothetical protein